MLDGSMSNPRPGRRAFLTFVGKALACAGALSQVGLERVSAAPDAKSAPGGTRTTRDDDTASIGGSAVATTGRPAARYS